MSDDLLDLVEIATYRSGGSHVDGDPVSWIGCAMTCGYDEFFVEDTSAAEVEAADLQRHLVRDFLDGGWLAADDASIGGEGIQSIEYANRITCSRS